MPERNTKNTKHQLDVAVKNNKFAKKAKNNELVPVPAKFQLLDRYWKASNYLSVGQVRYADFDILEYLC
jgi:phosphoketolase